MSVLNLKAAPAVKPSHLVELARDFAGIDRPSIEQATKFRDMFYVLILKTSGQERKKIAEILSRGHYTPRPVAIYFGMETIEISAPVLLFSPVLTDYDLTRIAEKNRFQHASVIARRNDLEAATVQALLKADNEQGTLRSLIRRNSSLANREEIQELLSAKPEPSLAETTTPSPQPKLEVVTNPEPVQASTPVRELSVTPKIELKPGRDISNRLLSVSRLMGDKTKAETRGNTPRSKNDGSFAVQMLTRARSVDIDGLTRLLDQRTGLGEEKLHSILVEENAGMQASLFCALGVGKTNTSKLLLLLNRNVGRNADVFRKIMRKFDHLTQAECQAFFTKMGASFDTDQAKPAQPLRYVGHFSSAIAERRRNISESSIEREQHEFTDKRDSAG